MKGIVVYLKRKMRDFLYTNKFVILNNETKFASQTSIHNCSIIINTLSP